MLCLRQQIGRDEECVCALVRDHQHLRGTGWQVARGARRVARDLKLRLRHPRVTGSEDLVHAGDARRAVGERRDGLRPAHLEDPRDAEEPCGDEDVRVDRAVRARWSRQHPHLAARDRRRYAEHQHRGREGRRAAWHVEPDPADGDEAPLAAHAGRCFEIDREWPLRLVKEGDAPDRLAKVSENGRRDRARGGLHLCSSDLQRREVDPVEATRQLEHGGISPRPHVAQDCPHDGLQLLAPVGERPLQQPPASLPVQLSPPDDVHRHAITFSIGNTRIELAPTAFRFSMVSQKMFSRATA